MQTTYSLEYCIMHNSLIAPQRRKTVWQTMVDNDIYNWTLFVDNWKVPWNGKYKNLTKNETSVLADIYRKEIYIRERKKISQKELRASLGKFASKHEATRIFNILVANGFHSRQLVRATSNEKLRNLPGIGTKSIDILVKVKFDKSAPRVLGRDPIPDILSFPSL